MSEQQDKESLCGLCSASLKEHSVYFSITYHSENYVHLCGKCTNIIEDARRRNYCTIVRRAEKRADKKMLEIYKTMLTNKGDKQ